MEIIKTTVAKFTEKEERAIADLLQIKAEVYAFCNARCSRCPFQNFCESDIKSVDEFKKKLTPVFDV